MTKTFCDMCEEVEIKGGAPGSFSFFFIKSRTSTSDTLDVQRNQCLLCEECAEKVAKFLRDNGLDKKEE